MHAAASNRNLAIITALLMAGEDTNAYDKIGATALMYAAASNSNPEVIITLLKAGADGKAKDKGGETAFDQVQKNYMLKGTDAYRQLQEASQ